MYMCAGNMNNTTVHRQMQFAGNSFVTRSILVAATADRSQIDDQVERWLTSEECLDADNEDEPEGGLTLKTFIAHLTANIMKALLRLSSTRPVTAGLDCA